VWGWDDNRVDRVPGFLSSRPNWLRPPPHPQGSVAPPLPLWSGGAGEHAGGRGGRVANSDEGTDTLLLCRYSNPSMGGMSVLGVAQLNGREEQDGNAGRRKDG
jgi:hypothetical protein